jgi:hypothetical protein
MPPPGAPATPLPDSVRREIAILQSLRHRNVLEYVDAFFYVIDPSPAPPPAPKPAAKPAPKARAKARARTKTKAKIKARIPSPPPSPPPPPPLSQRRGPGYGAIYTAYCEHGTLADLLGSYRLHQRQTRADPPARPPLLLLLPEAFARHVVHSLAAALAYLHDGVDDDDNDATGYPRRTTPGWAPIVHGDLQLHNIFLAAPAPPPAPLSGRDNNNNNNNNSSSNSNSNRNSSSRSVGARASIYPRIVVGGFGSASIAGDAQLAPPSPLTLEWDGSSRGWIRHRRRLTYVAPPEWPAAPRPSDDVWALGAVMQRLCHQPPPPPQPQPPPPSINNHNHSNHHHHHNTVNNNKSNNDDDDNDNDVDNSDDEWSPCLDIRPPPRDDDGDDGDGAVSPLLLLPPAGVADAEWVRRPVAWAPRGVGPAY